MLYRLAFTEPSSTLGTGVLRPDIEVDEAMYQVINRGPRRLSCEATDGNAYVFTRIPLDLRPGGTPFVRVAKHSNDAAQTGLVDVALVDAARSHFDTHDIIYRAYARNYDWDDRAALAEVQKVVPAVRFLGETRGGDVGASLYAHRDPRTGLVDALIIDNNCVFKEEEE